MYKVSKNYRTQIYSEESDYTANLIIAGKLVPVTQIESIEIDSPIFDNEDGEKNFYLGTFISQKITIKFRNLDGLDIVAGNDVSLDIGQMVDSSYEFVPIGRYVIDDLAEDYQTSCEITCLDYAVKFKPNIDISKCFSKKIKPDGSSVDTGRIDDILKYICSYFGVELGSYPRINGDIETSDFDTTVSGKRYVSYIAEIKGCMAKMDRYGKLALIPFNHASEVSINALKSKSWELGEKYSPSKIIYFDAIRNFTYGDDTGNTIYIREDNPFIADKNVVENIYNNVIHRATTISGKTLLIDNSISSKLDFEIQGSLSYEQTNIPIYHNDLPLYYNDIPITWKMKKKFNPLQTFNISIANDDGSKSQSKSLNLSALRLFGLDREYDYLYRIGTTWHMKRKFKEYTITGNENIKQVSTTNNITRFSIPLSNINNSINHAGNIVATSNYYDGISYNDSGTKIDTICSQNDGNSSNILIDTNEFNNITDFKNFISGSWVKVLYLSDEEIDTEITDDNILEELKKLDDLATYSGATKITSSADINLTYYDNKPLEIYSLTNENYGDPSLDAWDIIGFNLDDKTYYAYNDNTLTYRMAIMANIHPKINAKYQEVTTNVVIGDEIVRYKRLRTTLDYVNNQISLMISENDGNQEQLSEIRQSLNNILNIFQITGGNNLIKNSMFLFGDQVWEFSEKGSDTQYYHTELGNSYNALLIGKTTSVANIKLRNITINTTADNITGLNINQTYTLSYKYSQDDLTETTISLFSTSTNQTLITQTYSKKIDFRNEKIQFVAKESSYTLKIMTKTTSSSDNGYFTIYDLMLSQGDSTIWQPANGEIYSTILKLSQAGLQANSTGSKIATLMTSQGFQIRGYDNDTIGDIITEFTNTGLITKDIYANQIVYQNMNMTTRIINGIVHYIRFIGE